MTYSELSTIVPVWSMSRYWFLAHGPAYGDGTNLWDLRSFAQNQHSTRRIILWSSGSSDHLLDLCIRVLSEALLRTLPGLCALDDHEVCWQVDSNGESLLFSSCGLR